MFTRLLNNKASSYPALRVDPEHREKPRSLGKILEDRTEDVLLSQNKSTFPVLGRGGCKEIRLGPLVALGFHGCCFAGSSDALLLVGLLCCCAAALMTSGADPANFQPPAACGQCVTWIYLDYIEFTESADRTVSRDASNHFGKHQNQEQGQHVKQCTSETAEVTSEKSRCLREV